MRRLAVLLAGAGLALASPAVSAKGLEIARIYIEYNESANDLGFHVSLDAEDWQSLEIQDPGGTVIFDVDSAGGYTGLGLTELFFEGAEPTLTDFPLDQLLARFPEGRYRFTAALPAGGRLSSAATLSHTVPAGPRVSTQIVNGAITIRWRPVTTSAAILPGQAVTIVGYQVLVDPFQVTLPASATQVTLPSEFAASLSRGAHPFEVLAIDASGNQTITEGVLVKP
ncbi:MAG TPA: hypothetical protein VFO11_06440 [Candidatus Polarisedimenticolaceae bacterium]|nr:hypothetical protein [Candidatus Polarisedimenticolaceae bacterium]